MNNVRLGTMLAALTVGAMLTIAATPKAHAEDARAKCQSRVERAQDHYRHEAREHGRNSHEAREARTKLTSVWDRCYTEANGWYDPNRREWRTDRDWDRNYDWDRDRDDDHDRH